MALNTLSKTDFPHTCLFFDQDVRSTDIDNFSNKKCITNVMQKQFSTKGRSQQNKEQSYTCTTESNFKNNPANAEHHGSLGQCFPVISHLL